MRGDPQGACGVPHPATLSRRAGSSSRMRHSDLPRDIDSRPSSYLDEALTGGSNCKQWLDLRASSPGGGTADF
jgi:hypothetical protein